MFNRLFKRNISFAAPKATTVIETTESHFKHSQRTAMQKLYKTQTTLIETGAPTEAKTEAAKLIEETRKCNNSLGLASLWNRQQNVHAKCSPATPIEVLIARLR